MNKKPDYVPPVLRTPPVLSISPQEHRPGRLLIAACLRQGLCPTRLPLLQHASLLAGPQTGACAPASGPLLLLYTLPAALSTHPQAQAPTTFCSDICLGRLLLAFPAPSTQCPSPPLLCLRFSLTFSLFIMLHIVVVDMLQYFDHLMRKADH